MTGKTLLRRYARGERDFRGIVLRGVDLSEATLAAADFSEADLSRQPCRLPSLGVDRIALHAEMNEQSNSLMAVLSVAGENWARRS